MVNRIPSLSKPGIVEGRLDRMYKKGLVRPSVETRKFIRYTTSDTCDVLRKAWYEASDNWCDEHDKHEWDERRPVPPHILSRLKHLQRITDALRETYYQALNHSSWSRVT